MIRFALYLALMGAVAMPATAQEWNPYNEWDWASRAMHEGQSIRNAPRYQPYRYEYQNLRPYYRPRPQHRVYRAHDESHEERQAKLARLDRLVAERNERRGPTVHGFVQRHEHGDGHRGRCRAEFQAVGDQALTEDGAKSAAEKAFQQEIRFAHGELWADPAHASNKVFLCVKSSVGGGLFNRCRMKARPCMPERQG